MSNPTSLFNDEFSVNEYNIDNYPIEGFEEDYYESNVNLSSGKMGRYELDIEFDVEQE